MKAMTQTFLALMAVTLVACGGKPATDKPASDRSPEEMERASYELNGTWAGALAGDVSIQNLLPLQSLGCKVEKMKVHRNQLRLMLALKGQCVTEDGTVQDLDVTETLRIVGDRLVYTSNAYYGGFDIEVGRIKGSTIELSGFGNGWDISGEIRVENGNELVADFAVGRKLYWMLDGVATVSGKLTRLSH